VVNEQLNFGISAAIFEQPTDASFRAKTALSRQFLGKSQAFMTRTDHSEGRKPVFSPQQITTKINSSVRAKVGAKRIDFRINVSYVQQVKPL
jgi:hypothetical protein